LRRHRLRRLARLGQSLRRAETLLDGRPARSHGPLDPPRSEDRRPRRLRPLPIYFTPPRAARSTTAVFSRALSRARPASTS
jgi:hypothetical protein